MNKYITYNEITFLENQFPYKDLIETDYFNKYKKSYYEQKNRGFQLGFRNYYNLLLCLYDIHIYNKQHVKGFIKRLKTEKNDWRNSEAVFSEIIVYHYYIRLVYENLIKSIQKINDECDIIIELIDGSEQYLEVFSVMPNLKKPKNGEIVLNDIKTHTQTEFASIRQKLLNKIRKQKQFQKQRDNFAVIELNDPSIAGNFPILSSLSDGYKITIDKNSMETISADYDWSNSIFHDESTKYLKGVIYFSLGNYYERKIIINSNYEKL